MPLFLSKYFGELDLERPNEWYESETQLNDIRIEIVITIPKGAEKTIPQNIQAIDDYLDRLAIHEKAIRQFINKDFNKKGETNTYLELQLENQEKEDLEIVVAGIKKKITIKQKLLSILHPITLVFYPDEADNMFAVLDYTISEDLTDHLLAIKIYKDNHIAIDIES